MNATHLIIFNRSGAMAEGWIHVVPKGELPNREAGLTQVLDDASLDSILRNIAADRQRLGDRWPGIYAGREHFIYNDEQDSAALAWFKEFEKRGDGLWAKADGLTPIGKQVLANSEYKFTSFVADRRDTEKLAGNKVRILKLDTIGFTNQANGKELLSPITNRAGATAPADSNNKTTTGPKMKSVCTLLGLSAEADESSVHAAVTKLLNRAEITPGELTTLRNRGEITPDALKTLREENAKLLDEQVDALLAGHGVKEEKIINRLKPVLAGLKNREDRVATLTDFGFKPLEAGKGTAQTRVLNRGEGKPGTAATEDAGDEKVVADKIRNRASELQHSAPTRNWDSCWTQASREITTAK